MQVTVTGANGYLGRGVVAALLDLGADVFAVDYQTDGVDNRAMRKNLDLFSLKDPFEALGYPDVLLHLAWREGFVHNSPYHLNDLPKHCGFIKQMIDSGIHQVAVMGTMHEVGFYEGCITDETPCRPMNYYGISKNALRQFLEVVGGNSESVWQWLRGYYIVGKAINGSSIFSKIAKAAENGERFFPFTSGANQFDFLDYDDFCKLVALSVLQDEIAGIIEICSGRPESLASRVERYIEENQFDIELQYGQYPDRPYESKAVWGDSSKIEAVVNSCTTDRVKAMPWN